MNRTQSVALFAGIFAIAMTTYGLSGVSASPMMLAPTSQTAEGVAMLGHVEYVVYDENNQITSYLQSDNVVVEDGLDCVGELLFGDDGSGGATSCGGVGVSTNNFDWIAIGNHTDAAPATDGTEDQLDTEGGSGCADSTVNGEMARKQVTPVQTDAPDVATGTIVVLDVLTDTFSFDAANATTITQSGLFNNGTTNELANGACNTLGVPHTNWEMFAIKNLSGTGVQVNDGDSLAVKWTITIK